MDRVTILTILLTEVTVCSFERMGIVILIYFMLLFHVVLLSKLADDALLHDECL